MSDNYSNLDYLDLQTLFVAKNKAFTEALRLKQPAPRLNHLYSELDTIYRLIKEKRTVMKMAAMG
jgi:hypothetical protein